MTLHHIATCLAAERRAGRPPQPMRASQQAPRAPHRLSASVAVRMHQLCPHGTGWVKAVDQRAGQHGVEEQQLVLVLEEGPILLCPASSKPSAQCWCPPLHRLRTDSALSISRPRVMLQVKLISSYARQEGSPGHSPDHAQTCTRLRLAKNGIFCQGCCCVAARHSKCDVPTPGDMSPDMPDDTGSSTTHPCCHVHNT